MLKLEGPRLAWHLHKNHMQVHEALHFIFQNRENVVFFTGVCFACMSFCVSHVCLVIT